MIGMVRSTGTTHTTNGGGSSASGSGGSPPSRRFPQQYGPSSSRAQFPTPSTSSPARARIRIVPEIYNDYNQIGLRQALTELDAALNERCPVIVLEPMNLGDQTTRWIRIGNGLHKTAVLCGTASSLGFWIGDPWSNTGAQGLWYVVCGALAFVGLAAHAVHMISWQSDPCSYYQTESDPGRLTRLLADANYYTGSSVGGNGQQASTSTGIQAASVVVLVRKDVSGRRLLQNTAAGLTAAVILYRLYNRWF